MRSCGALLAPQTRPKPARRFAAKARGATRGGRGGVLNSEVWQGHFAEGLVQALACAAGLNPGKRSLDVEGVDIQIGFPGRHGTVRYPLIEAQVKSCCKPKVIDDCIPYSISTKNFNDLTGSVGVDLPVRRYLFLAHVPAEKSDYATISQDSINFHNAIYWVDLMDATPVDSDRQANKTVHVPRSNLLTVESLTDLVTGKIDEGGK